MILPRRGFLLGLAAMLAAPAIVRVESLMPVRSITRFYNSLWIEIVTPDGRTVTLQQDDPALGYHIASSAVCRVGLSA
jgi:hypothetical protein